MEEHVFYRPEVVRELQKFVEVRLHIDRDNDRSRQLAEKKAERHEGNISLPTYEIVDPSTQKTLDIFFGADPGGEKFSAFLRNNSP